MYWLKLSSRKQKTINNKIYFATEYAKDVLDKHAGEPCAYIEDINSIDIFNDNLPFSADETCFIGENCFISNECVLKNVVVSGKSIITGDIGIFNSSLINVEIYADKRRNPDEIQREINGSAIFAEKNISAKIKIEGSDSAFIVLDSNISLTSKLSRKQDTLLFCVDLGGFLTISESTLELSKYGISVHKNVLEISNTNMREGSRIDIFEGEPCSIARSEIRGEIFGHSLHISETTLEGKIVVGSGSKGFSSITCNVCGNAKIGISGGWLFLENTEVSDFSTIKIKDTCDDIVVITDCKIKDFSIIEYYKPRECNNTVFSDSCIVRDAACYDSSISGTAYVYAVTVNHCKISGNARVGADIESVDIPYDIASKTVVRGSEISGLLDFYSIKIHNNKYATIDSYFSFISDEHGLLHRQDISDFFLQEIKAVRQTKGFILNNILNFSYEILFENSVDEAKKFLKETYENQRELNRLVRSLVHCSILRLLSLCLTDNSSDLGLDIKLLDRFSSYAVKCLRFDIFSKSFVGYNENIIVFPKIIENIPDSLATWFTTPEEHNGFAI